MARYGKIRIKEENNRGYVHRHKHRTIMQSRKIFIVYKTTKHARNRVTIYKQRISINTLNLNKEFNHIYVSKLKNCHLSYAELIVGYMQKRIPLE
jgi:hypothetical protein